MGHIRKIMAGFDLSADAAHALGYAITLAEDLDAELLVVNVINQRDVDAIQHVAMEYSNMSVPKWISDQQAYRAEEMDKIIDEISTGKIVIRKVFCTGVPFVELVSAIHEHDIDLMVMGSKGRGNLAGVLFGATAEKMFRKCPVPLLSIRKEPE